MSDSERHALTLTLMGTGKDGDPPGPLHPGWIVKHLAGSRTTLMRWRERGVPPDRLDDVLDAVRGLVPDIEKEALPPQWARGLEAQLDLIAVKVGVDPTLLAEIRAAHRAVADSARETQPRDAARQTND